ncbi:MAG TPA: hypothetical protein VN962_03330 [Polyangia bacterium]|nr:hypothetical protein [Polyangia bacterium]
MGMLGALFGLQSPARAFVTPCHQGITTDALAQSGWPLAATSPPLTGDDELLLRELPISVAPSARNLWSLSLLAGNLWVDLGPDAPDDVAALAQLAAVPDLQRTHCLRGSTDDGDTGNANAVASCRAYILEQVGLALGDGDVPDLDAREPVRLHLEFRGPADIPLPRYAFHMGCATHALEDGFSHAFRSADEHQVKTLLNWVDWVGDNYDEARDGFQHLYALDQCGPTQPDSDTAYDRVAAAKQAVAELLAAAASDDGGRAGRLARVSSVLDSWFGIQPGCEQANGWCDAPQRFQTSAAGCAVGAGAPSSRPAEIVLLCGVILACRRRRGRRRNGYALLAVLALLSLPVYAAGAESKDDAKSKDDHAKSKDDDGEDGRGEVKGGLIAKATPEEQRLLELRRFGVVVKGAIGIDNAAWDVGAGLRYDLTKAVTIGADAELNPWFSVDSGHQVLGATNVYAVGIYRLDVRDYLEARFTLAVGISVLNFDTFAARSGSVGPYVAVSPLGIAIRAGSHVRFILDPGEIAIPIPQTTGIPLVYRQHRFSFGVQTNF